MLVDLARRSCYAGLQPTVTKRIGTVARGKALMMLQRSCYAELQLDVAKRTVLATRREELGSSIHPSIH